MLFVVNLPFILGVIMLNVIMLSGIKLNAIMLSVVAPFETEKTYITKGTQEGPTLNTFSWDMHNRSV
jgi:hypothetical protein